MKKIIFFAVMACIFASCNEYKSTETPINGTDLTLFSTQTADKQGETYGVKDATGTEIISPEYNSIIPEGNDNNTYLIARKGDDAWLFKTDGTGINENGASISINEGYVQFYYGEAVSSFYFEKYDAHIGPFLNAQVLNDFLFIPDEKNLVLNTQGDTIVSGDRVVYLTSVADKKDYFLATNGKTTKAYSTDGKVLFKVSAKKMKNLPAPGWTCGENIYKVLYQKKAKSLK